QSSNTTRSYASEPITMIDNMITFKDPPFYESTSAKLISQRVLNAYQEDDSRHSSPNEDYPLIESTIMETGNLRGTGNVTNIGTWIDNYRAEGVTFNTGRGIMSTIDGKSTAPWRAYDIGRTDDNGNRTFKGIMFFNNNTNGELEFLSNVEALYIIKPSDRQPTFLMWKWN
ncbi:MAG: hypothetical protein ACRD8Z_18590, partial [Nitrososphaeraceae archaeon]